MKLPVFFLKNQFIKKSNKIYAWFMKILGKKKQ